MTTSMLTMSWNIDLPKERGKKLMFVLKKNFLENESNIIPAHSSWDLSQLSFPIQCSKIQTKKF